MIVLGSVRLSLVLCICETEHIHASIQVILTANRTTNRVIWFGSMTIWDVKMGQGRDMNNNISNRSVKIVSKAPKQHKKERKEDIFYHFKWMRVIPSSEMQTQNEWHNRNFIWKIRGHITRPSSLENKSNALMKWLTSNWEIQFVVARLNKASKATERKKGKKMIVILQRQNAF